MQIAALSGFFAVQVFYAYTPATFSLYAASLYYAILFPLSLFKLCEYYCWEVCSLCDRVWTRWGNHIEYYMSQAIIMTAFGLYLVWKAINDHFGFTAHSEAAMNREAVKEAHIRLIVEDGYTWLDLGGSHLSDMPEEYKVCPIFLCVSLSCTLSLSVCVCVCVCVRVSLRRVWILGVLAEVHQQRGDK